MTDEEQSENISELIKFLNKCISASNKIELKDSAVPESLRDYKIKDTQSAISFITNRICIIGMCKKKQLGYGMFPNAPYVYEYVFRLKDMTKELGCLAFHNNPRKQTKIKLQIKSLHKDYQDVIPFKKNENIEIEWLTQEQVNMLPICKGDNEIEMSNM